ncbi:MAG: hypothetical protein EPN61_14890 [Burkholderiaceae bacterium]|nr:MAG: hypothetical protein EPN61_14890 [Burkholderiaceae bacterium]
MNQNKPNPAGQSNSSLSSDLAKQLETVEGAKALVSYYKKAFTDANGSLKSIYRERADTAQQMVDHLEFQARAMRVEKTIEQDKAAAVKKIKVLNEELNEAKSLLDEAIANRKISTGKINDLQSAADRQEQEYLATMNEARSAFEQAMRGDDDEAQRIAAERLSKAEITLALCRQYRPNDLRLSVLKEREAGHHDSIAEISRQVADAQEALNQAVLMERLLHLDDAANQMLLAYIDVLSAARGCVKPQFLNGFGAITLWASSERRISTLTKEPSGAAVVLSGPTLAHIFKVACRPDLSIFTEEPNEG